MDINVCIVGVIGLSKSSDVNYLKREGLSIKNVQVLI